MILAVDLCDVTAAIYIPAKRLPPVEPWPGQGSLPVSLKRLTLQETPQNNHWLILHTVFQDGAHSFY